MHKAIEPTAEERPLAIRICRLNAFCDPNTGKPMDHEIARQLWRIESRQLPTAKWIWMWRNAREEWDLRAQSTSEAVK